MKSISKITINQNDNVSEIMMDISSMADKVEEFTGLKVEKVNIFVEGVRVID